MFGRLRGRHFCLFDTREGVTVEPEQSLLHQLTDGPGRRESRRAQTVCNLGHRGTVADLCNDLPCIRWDSDRIPVTEIRFEMDSL